MGSLGKRAGLDIKEHYDNIIMFDMFPNAKFVGTSRIGR